jgi:formylglycine-generating enzyme required for sulfatase activity
MKTTEGCPLKRQIAIAVVSIGLLSATQLHPFAANGSDQSAGKVALKSKTNAQDEQVYVWIPPGNFTMGCSPGDNQCFSEEKPAHEVNISQGFWIGQTEVTIHAYEKFAGITDSSKTSGSGDSSTSEHESDPSMPAVNVTWDEANDFCKWAGGRLPTEAEWEYAARAGTSTSRYGELDEIAWYDKNSGNSIHKAGQKRANNFGLFDMLGNTWEWVSDFYDGKYYSRSPQSDPTGPVSGKLHGLRGGSWLNNSKLVRVSDRGRSTPELRFNYFGLRCVLTGDSHQ